MRMSSIQTQVISVYRDFLFVIGGCATKTKANSGAGDEPIPNYFDFGDVPVPSELKLDKSSSFVYSAGHVTAGVLSLKGYLDLNSLIVFFETNMPEQNWKILSSFRSPRSILIFRKPQRICVVNITEKRLYTYLEIWVAPVTESDSSDEMGLLKEQLVD